MTLGVLAAFVARVCLVVMFPFSALEKVIWWRNCVAQARGGGLPGAPVLVVLGIIVEAVTPVMIVTGWHDRLGAFILAGFCVVTAVLYHQFWTFPDFWSPRADSQAREHFWQFLKNFGLVGGLLLVLFAGSLTDPWAVLAHPFDSSHPYAAVNAP